MGLTTAQLAARKGKLTASRVAVLMGGDASAIYNLWLELTGQPFDEEDLSSVWHVQLGSATEMLNLHWFALKHGAIDRIGDVVVHDSGDYAATLDAWSVSLACPIECKHVGGFESLETIIDRYQPQMHWQMIMTQATRCALSVIMGAQEPVVEIIDYDPAYGLEMQLRAASFMEHVKARTNPVVLPPLPVPVIPDRVVDMTGNNEWADMANVWLTNKISADLCKGVEKDLKAAMPADALQAHGHGIRIKRDRAGRLSLREDNTPPKRKEDDWVEDAMFRSTTSHGQDGTGGV